MSIEPQEIMRRVTSLFAPADQLEARLSAAQRQVDALTPSLLARAWTHSPPARLGYALSLREILFAHSQRVQISGELVPQDPTDEPADKLLNRIKEQKRSER